MMFKSQNIYEGFKYPLKVGVCDVNTPSNICVLLFLIWHVRIFDFLIYPQPQIPLFPDPAIKKIRQDLGRANFKSKNNFILLMKISRDLTIIGLNFRNKVLS